MKSHELQSLVSRRALIGGSGAAMVAPLLLGKSSMGVTRSKKTDKSSHPAVGLWIERGTAPKFSYDFFHADGTHQYYSATASANVGGDPHAATFGFGVWEPHDNQTINVTWRAAWGDTSLTDLLTVSARLTVDESGMQIGGPYKETLADSSGAVYWSGGGTMTADRMQVEPIDSAATPEAAPG